MLRVDRSAAAAVPDQRELSAWASSQRVFVSSVMAGMVDERIAAASAVRQVGAQPVVFEDFGGRDADPEDAYLGEVASSDVYVGILGRSYGRLLPSRRSATHEEFREAERQGLRISAWTSAARDWGGDQQEFVDEVRLFHVTGTYTDPEHLAAGVADRLRSLAAEELSPWVKLGTGFTDGVIFRAREVRDEGSKLVVYAEVKEREIVNELERLREGFFAAWRGRLTWASSSAQVKAKKVTTSWATSRSAVVTVELEREDLPVGEPWSQMAYRVAATQYSADDITELALKHLLLGEAHPLGTMGFLARIDDPIAALRDLQLPDETLRPVASLLFTEALVGSGRASQLVSVRIGVPIEGKRSLEVRWRATARTSGGDDERKIAGRVQL